MSEVWEELKRRFQGKKQGGRQDSHGQRPALSALSLPFGRVGDVGVTNIAAQRGCKGRSLAKLLDSPSAVLTRAFHSSGTEGKRLFRDV